jgi:hypothetical protein
MWATVRVIKCIIVKNTVIVNNVCRLVLIKFT